MTIIRWQQRPALARMMDNFFERDFVSGFDRNCGCAPATNILEKPDQFEVQLAVPGLKKEDFHMEIENDLLTVSYQKKEDESNGIEENFLRREYAVENFTRSFTIPKHVSAEQISARYENGMLYITIPRTDAQKEKLSKRIEIA